jgi:dTDP-4-dehydrorhamnose 3,5-epimerase
MRFLPTSLPDVLVIESDRHEDERGYLMETYRADAFAAAGIGAGFVQDNHASSRQGALRGLHYQIRHSQGKLIRVVAGAIFDVAVHLRRSSPAFGRWLGVELTANQGRMLWIPPEFAHGLYTLSDRSEVIYKMTDYSAPDLRPRRARDHRSPSSLSGPPSTARRVARARHCLAGRRDARVFAAGSQLFPGRPGTPRFDGRLPGGNRFSHGQHWPGGPAAPSGGDGRQPLPPLSGEDRRQVRLARRAASHLTPSLADFPTAARRPSFSALDSSLFRRTFNLSLPAWQEGLRLAMETG